MTPVLTTGIVDLHHSDGSYDLHEARKAGLVALIHKATQGKDWRDPRFPVALCHAAEARLLRGAYHFGSNSSDGAQQADWFLETVQPYLWEPFLLALDWEGNPDREGGDMTLDGALAFVERVRLVTGRWPVLYSGLSFLRRQLARADQSAKALLAQCPLWLAAYGPDPMTLRAPGEWPSWSLQQYTNGSDGPRDQATYPRKTPGFARAAQDRSVFRGTPHELVVWWGTAGS